MAGQAPSDFETVVKSAAASSPEVLEAAAAVDLAEGRVALAEGAFDARWRGDAGFRLWEQDAAGLGAGPLERGLPQGELLPLFVGRDQGLGRLRLEIPLRPGGTLTPVARLGWLEGSDDADDRSPFWLPSDVGLGEIGLQLDLPLLRGGGVVDASAEAQAASLRAQGRRHEYARALELAAVRAGALYWDIVRRRAEEGALQQVLRRFERGPAAETPVARAVRLRLEARRRAAQGGALEAAALLREALAEKGVVQATASFPVVSTPAVSDLDVGRLQQVALTRRHDLAALRLALQAEVLLRDSAERAGRSHLDLRAAATYGFVDEEDRLPGSGDGARGEVRLDFERAIGGGAHAGRTQQRAVAADTAEALVRALEAQIPVRVQALVEQLRLEVSSAEAADDASELLRAALDDTPDGGAWLLLVEDLIAAELQAIESRHVVATVLLELAAETGALVEERDGAFELAPARALAPQAGG